jgi:hypothetical protein
MNIHVTNNLGWSKLFPLQKALNFVGSRDSEPRDDVLLKETEGSADGSVQPRHAQLLDLKLHDTQGNPLYRLVNLTETVLRVGLREDDATNPAESAEMISVHSFEHIEVTIGQPIWIGNYRLMLTENSAPLAVNELATSTTRPQSTGSQNSADFLNNGQTNLRSAVIGLEVRLPYNKLAPDTTVDCTILIRNNGAKNAVQFQIDIEGLPPEAYDLADAGPVLFPGVPAEVMLRLKHPCTPALDAGEYQLLVRVTAPNFYLGERAVETRKLYVLPCYRYLLRKKDGRNHAN